MAKIFVLLLLPLGLFAQGGESELISKAQSLFEQGNYLEAMPLYGQLVSLHPTNAVYNYKYGTCLIYGEEDKEKAVSFLAFATKQGSAPNLAWYQYGKALHLNYRFSDAVNAYTKYQNAASKKELLAQPVAADLAAARNGTRLLSDLKDISVVDKLDVGDNEFFRYFDLSEIGGKVLQTPEELQTSLDRKKGEHSLVHFPKQGDVVYFSSYGKDGRTGRDIYRAYTLPDGKFSEPMKLAGYVNTEHDEEYPFMHPDGKTFYFCSKGHNSMGGYDVFRSTYDEASDLFGPATNLDFAINSPDDDIFYIVDSLFDMAFFASGRNSAQGRIHVYKVKNERSPLNLALIQGTFLSEITPQNKKAKITVENALNREMVGEFQTDPKDGSYVIVLPHGGKYRMIVEAEESRKTHIGVVDIPKKDEVHGFRQETSLVMHNDLEKLVIRNLFDEPVSGDMLALAMAEIKRRAALDVNFVEGQEEEVAEEKSVADASLDAGFSGDLSNEDIVNMAFEDAAAIEREGQAIEDRADLAFTLANKKSEEARTAVTMADSLLQLAEAQEDNAEKRQLIEDANASRQVSERLNREAKVAMELATSLEKTRALKAEEAADAVVYARSLESAINSDSYEEAFAKLSEQKQKLEESSGPGGQSTDVYQVARQKALDKQDEADKAMARANSIRDEETDLRTRMTRARTQMEGTSSKSKKEEFQAELDGYQADLELVQQDIAKAFEQAEAVQEEADLLDAQAQLYFAISNDTPTEQLEEALVLSDQEKQRLRDEIAENEQQLGQLQIEHLVADGDGGKEAASQRSEVDGTLVVEEQEEAIRERTEAMDNRETELDRASTESALLSEQQGADQDEELAASEEVPVDAESSDRPIDDNSRTQELGDAASEPTSTQVAEAVQASDRRNSELAPGTGGAVESAKEQLASDLDWIAILDADIEDFQGKAAAENDPEKKDELLSQAAELRDLREQKQLEVSHNEGVLAAAAMDPTTGARSAPLASAVKVDDLHPEYQSEWQKVASTDLDEVDRLRAWAALDREVAGKAQDAISEQIALIGEAEDDEMLMQDINELRAVDKRMRAEAAELEARAERIGTELMASDESNGPSSTETMIPQGSVNSDYVKRAEHRDIYDSEIAFRSKAAKNAYQQSSDELEKIQTLSAEIQELEEQLPEITDAKLREDMERRIFKMRDDHLIYSTNIGQRSQYQNRLELDHNEDSLKTLLARVESEMEVSEFDPTMSFIHTHDDRALTKFSEAKALRKRADREMDQVEKDRMLREAYSMESWALLDMDQAITATNYMLSDSYQPGEEVTFEEMQKGAGIAPSLADAYTGEEESAEPSEPIAVESNGVETSTTGLQEAGAEASEEVIADTAEMEEGNADEVGVNEQLDQTVVAAGNTESNENTTAPDTSQTVSAESFITDAESGRAQEESEEVADNSTEDSNTPDDSGMEDNAEVPANEEATTEAANTEPEAVERVGNEVRIGDGLVISDRPDAASSHELTEPTETSNVYQETLQRANEMEQQADSLAALAAAKVDSSYSANWSTRNRLKEEAAELELQASATRSEAQTTRTDAEQLAQKSPSTLEGTTVSGFSQALARRFGMTTEQAQQVEQDPEMKEYFQQRIAVMDQEVQLTDLQKSSAAYRAQAEAANVQADSLRLKANTASDLSEQQELDAQAARSIEEAIVLNERADSLDLERVALEQRIFQQQEAARRYLDGLTPTLQASIAELEGVDALAQNEASKRVEDAETPASTLEDLSEPTVDGQDDGATLQPEAVVEESPWSDPTHSPRDNFGDAEPRPKTLVADIFLTNSSERYSADNPIPIDPEMPDGLVYKVQVGAFRNDIDQDLYEGFSPIMGERLDNGITRYTAGMFTTYSSAGLAKEIIQDKGYEDAFIVAFFNGERVDIGSALDLQEQQPLAEAANDSAASNDRTAAEGQRPDYQPLQADTSAVDPSTGDVGIEVSSEEVEMLSAYPSTSEELLNSFNPEEGATDYYNVPGAAEATQVETVRGLFYTVQVGVYSKPVPASAIFNLEPLNSQLLESGLVRYTTGRYTDLDEARQRKDQIVVIGVSDAFLTAYVNGKRIPMKEAAALIKKFGPSIFATQ